jgi:hypothetical protein
VTRVGAERIEVLAIRGVRGDDQAVPDDAWSGGCGWAETFAFAVAADWPSGHYEIELLAEGEGDWRNAGHAFFTVVAPDPDPDRPLLLLATNTYQAYNQWGGRCMYSGATTVSLDRPIERGYIRRDAAPFDVEYDGRFADTTGRDREHRRIVDYQTRHGYPVWTSSAGWHNWERRFVRWAETAGFGIDVATNGDLHRGAAILEGRRLVVSVGHDEYWTAEMRDHIDDFVDGGGRWAIFSGNTCFWQVRFDADGRRMTCFKSVANDPVAEAEPGRATGPWSHPHVGRPENLTIGLSFTRGGYARIGDATPNSAGGFEVQRPDHWSLAGTRLRYGDQLGASACVVGYEVDGCDLTRRDNLLVPTGIDGTPTDFEVIGVAPAHLLSITDEVCEVPVDLWASIDPPGDLEDVAAMLLGPDAAADDVAALGRGRAVIGEFHRHGGSVFVAGTADWAFGLDTDRDVQTVTGNVLRRYLEPA